jgi:hypothetical protein
MFVISMGDMSHSLGCYWCGAKGFLHACVYIWKVRSISKIGKPVMTDDMVYLLLSSALGCGIEEHTEHKSYHGRNGLYGFCYLPRNPLIHPKTRTVSLPAM